jgi:hypothetical protein
MKSETVLVSVLVLLLAVLVTFHFFPDEWNSLFPQLKSTSSFLMGRT